MHRLPLVFVTFAAGCWVSDEEALKYYDRDGDGVYVSEGAAFGATAPFDCDDGDAAVHPGAEEHCDGVDEDCDEDVDEDAVDGTTFFRDADQDGYGVDSDTVVACAAPELYAELGGDCDDTNATVRPVEWYADTDGDGYGDPNAATFACEQPANHVANADDCDDSDVAVAPGADEICDDDVDNDCDGDVDSQDAGPGDLVWYLDDDGDGYGDAGTSVSSCAQPTDHVADATDCNDASAAIHPGADEHCDGVDEDCDDVADEDPVDGTTWYRDADRDGYGSESDSVVACEAPELYIATGGDCDDTNATVRPTEWYADADGDGYGDPDVTTFSCTQPSDHVANTDDCDDTSAAIKPGATEDCDDTVDNDCDGAIDADDTGPGDLPWYLDADGDGYGDAGSISYSCAKPTNHVADATDCDDGASGVSPGAAEVCESGADEDCDGLDGTCGFAGTMSLSDATAILVGSPYKDDGAGYSLATGDLDGDGFDDLIAGAPMSNGFAGEAALQYGSESLLIGGGTLASLPTVSGNVGDVIGLHLESPGDLDQDGYDELFVDSQSNPDTDGQPFLIYGGPARTSGSVTISGVQFTGEALGGAGAGSAGGDLDGDGYPELLIGAPWLASGMDTPGAVYVFEGSSTRLSGTIALPTGASTVVRGELGQQIGSSLVVLPDADGDGLNEALIGGGSVWWYADLLASTTEATADADLVLTRDESSDAGESGETLASPGDVDGDGYAELVIGSPGYGSDTGRVYVWSGSATLGGTALLADAPTQLVAPGVADTFGQALAVGDYDDDGQMDLAVGAPRAEVGTSTDAGMVLVYEVGGLGAGTFATSAAWAQLEGPLALGLAGHAVRAGDLNGDAIDDLFVGAYGGVGDVMGRVYVLYGGP